MKKHLSSIIIVFVFMIGLSLLLYPTVSDRWNSHTQSKAIEEYDSALYELSEADYTAEFEKADRYNDLLKELPLPLVNYQELTDYDEILNIGGNGIIGYICIDKIGVELPIYHGTDEAVLNVAVGHLQGTSLPVGGEGTHCVLSAHRGLPSARLFTDLDELDGGDIFTITVLDRVLTYEVDQVLIVEPDEWDVLLTEDENDYCTLMTCTPYGINTHRLLVRGKRIENIEEEQKLRITSDAIQIEPVIVAPVVAVPLIIILMFLLVLKDRIRRKS